MTLSSQHLIMRNPFLIARYVLFSLLIYFNVMAIGFAAWNISSMKAAGLSVSGSPAFIIFNACFLFLFVVVALAEMVSSNARTAQVKFECTWTAVLSILQFASAIDISLNGPPAYCPPRVYFSVCSSSSVLVAITWASSTILVMYFLALIITATAHVSVYGAVWSTTVYNVPWFVDEQTIKIGFPQESPSKKVSKVPYENPVFRADEDEYDDAPLDPPSVPYAHPYDIDIEKYGIPKMYADPPKESLRDNARPNWAKRVNTRRGVDPPFAPASTTTKRISRAIKSYWSGTTTLPPTPPLKPTLPLLRNLNGGFIDCHRASYGQFPDDVTDYDLPIAQPRLTEWVKAERAVLAH